VVKNSYTNRLTNYLTSTDGENQQLCSCKSFASSGQTSAELLSALANDDNVKDAIRNADIITISIGANDILGNAAGTIVNYLTNKNATLGNMKDSVTTSLNKLLDVPASGSAPIAGAQGYYTIIHNLV
jgi:lysophospholipase L1-like esterase